MATRDSFLGVKRLGVIFNTDHHLGPSLRMSASVPRLNPMCFHGMNRDDFTCTFKITFTFYDVHIYHKLLFILS